MSTIIQKIFGILIIVIALVGLVFSAFILRSILTLQPTLAPGIDSAFQFSEDTLELTTESIDILDETLKTANLNIESTRAALLTLAQSVHQAAPILNSLSTITGQTLPDTLTATQASLVTAQTTAKTIEDLLTLITSIPLMPGEPYAPKVPLYTSLNQISTSLARVNPQLKTMESDLAGSTKNLASLEADVLQINQDLLKINANLAEASAILKQYRQLVADLQERLDALQAKLPTWIAAVTAFLIFILAWIAIFQVDLLIRGYRLARKTS